VGVTQQKYVRKIAEACSAQRQGEMGVKWSAVDTEDGVGGWVQCVGVAHMQAHIHTHFRFPGAPHPDAIIKFYQPGSKHPVCPGHSTTDQRIRTASRSLLHFNWFPSWSRYQLLAVCSHDSRTHAPQSFILLVLRKPLWPRLFILARPLIALPVQDKQWRVWLILGAVSTAVLTSADCQRVSSYSDKNCSSNNKPSMIKHSDRLN